MTISFLNDLLGVVVFVSEVFLYSKEKTKGASDVVKDCKSLRFIWRAIALGVTITFTSKLFVRQTIFSGGLFEYISCVALIAGMGIRWYSIYYLGRYFTVNVAIIEGHELITSGPYRYVRHPSYTGLLLIFLALGIHSNQIAGAVSLPMLAFLAVMNRICIEEVAISRTFRDEYDRYRNRTKLLIPWLY